MERVHPRAEVELVLSLSACSAMYLLHAIRAASRASLDTFSFSQLTRCTHSGNSSTPRFFCPTSKIRILGSGTPRQYRDLGYGLFLI